MLLELQQPLAITCKISDKTVIIRQGQKLRFAIVVEGSGPFIGKHTQYTNELTFSNIYMS